MKEGPKLGAVRDGEEGIIYDLEMEKNENWDCYVDIS